MSSKKSGGSSRKEKTASLKKEKKSEKKSSKKDKKTEEKAIKKVYNDRELAATAQAGVIEIALALFDFDARSDAELSFKKDQYIEILKKTETIGWWKGRLRGTSNTGLFPSNYAKVFYTITESDAVRTAEGSIRMTPEQQEKFFAAQEKRTGGDGDGSVSGGGNKITIATVLFDFKARKPEEISISKGEEITVVEGGARGGWWKGEKSDGTTGLFPSNYCQISERDVGSRTPKKMKELDKLRSRLDKVEADLADNDVDNEDDASGDVAELRKQLRAKDKQIRVLTEKLRIAEEIIENMDTMMKDDGGKKKEKNKYSKRQSSKF